MIKEESIGEIDKDDMKPHGYYTVKLSSIIYKLHNITLVDGHIFN